MQHSNLSKLIIGFLVLAVVVSTSAIFFSPPNRSSGQPTTEKSPQKEKGGVVNVPNNAFVEQLPPPAPANSAIPTDPADNDLPPITPTQNLTEKLAQHLAREMVRSNPQGPIVNDGGFALNLPENLESIAEQLTTASPNLEMEIEKDALVTVTEKNIRVIAPYTKEDIETYAAAINNIISGDLTQSRLATIINNSPPAEVVNVVGLVLDSAYLQAQKLPVPQPLVPFHKSFLHLLSYPKKWLSLTNNQDDPLRASLILETAWRNYEEEINRFNTELEKINSGDLSAKAEMNKLAVFLKIFLPVKTAYALSLFGVTITFSPAEFGQMIKNFVRTVLVEIMKDRLIHNMVTQIIRWIEGGGKPQFVTNWRAFLEDAANKAAGDVIYKLAPQMCAPFGPLIQLAFTTPPTESPVFCTLDQVVNNFRQFYDNFQTGGWIAYTTALQPQNNLFGLLAVSSDIVVIEGKKAKEEAKKKAETGGGFTPTELCAKWEDRNKWQQCVFENGSEEPCKGIPNKTERVCVKYQVTTPSSIPQQITVAALNSPFGRIFNAEDIAALTGAFINSALNRLLRAGAAGLFGKSSAAATTGETTAGKVDKYQTICEALDESIEATKRFNEFAVANRDQLKGGENFKVKADSVVWHQRAMDVSSPVGGLQNTISNLRDPAWDPVEVQIGRFTSWLEEVITSLIKDEDLDLDGEWNRSDPPTQGVQGVVRMTRNFKTYLENLKKTIKDCTNPNTKDFANIPDPELGFPGDGDEETSCPGGNANVCQSITRDAVLNILTKYAPTNDGIKEALPELQDAFGPQVKILEHPVHLDKIDFGGGLIVDVIIGAGGPNPSWGWIVDCECGVKSGGAGGGTGGGTGNTEPSSLLDDVREERAKYGAQLTPEEMGALVNAVAWKNRDAGWGLSRKDFGEYCPSPAGPVACDILHHKPSGKLFDVLYASNDPVWAEVPYHNDPVRRPWVAPVQP